MKPGVLKKISIDHMSLSARRAWIETFPAWHGQYGLPVALRKEGVD